MGDISEHFSRAEFSCRCNCGFDTVDTETLKILEEIRKHFRVPITVTSGCRCETYNKTVGGKKNSQHLRGRAADIQLENIAPVSVAEYASYLMSDYGGIGWYNTFSHIDTRADKARWGL